ncbi:hypothetical protein ACHAW5_004106 [Stephanodiscus triporus]|uniref:Uncharacterized protein n=1 Tax=Stephanodiscus triporus TaxID=2934178 RepID=A0ABD3NEE4_9STRA
MTARDPLLPTTERNSDDCVDEAQLPLLIVLVASFVLLLAIGAEYHWRGGGYYAYAMSVPSVCLVLSSVGLALSKHSDSEESPSRVGKGANALCFAYAFVGACFLTFDEPFAATGNGYFAAWTVVYASAMTIGIRAIGSTIRGLGALVGLLASSVVVIIASISPMKDANGLVRSATIFAIVLAVVSVGFVLLLMYLDSADRSMSARANFVALAVLAICWIVMACLVTFEGPFNATGNGYFASWAGVATASTAAFASKQALSDRY